MRWFALVLLAGCVARPAVLRPTSPARCRQDGDVTNCSPDTWRCKDTDTPGVQVCED